MKTVETPLSGRQYMIDLQRWRSLLALCACSVSLVCALFAFNASLLEYKEEGWDIIEFFRYFTTLSNIITALAVSFIIPFAVNGIRKKRFVYPRWLALLHYTGAIGTTLTMIFALTFILSYDPVFAVGGSNLFFHVVCPLLSLLTFELVESGCAYRVKDSLLCLIPFLVYTAVYFVMVVVIGKEKGGWEDLYMIVTFVPIYVSLPAIWLLVYAIAFALRKSYNALSRRRQEKMLRSWKEGLEPIEVNIEVYGLGRFHGLRDEKAELTVPYDILEALAGRYAMDTEALVKVYAKGLLEGVKERFSAGK